MSATIAFTRTRSGDASAAPLQPAFALILYQGSGSAVLKHPIHTECERPMLGAAAPLTEEDAQRLIVALGGQSLTPVQPNTLAVSPVATAWWWPPQARALMFDAKYTQTASIAQLSGVAIPLPGLVFIASPAQLRVFAVRGRNRPDLDTPLMHAPFWNVFATATVCRGTVIYPNTCTPESQSAWETSFFQSVFTGPSRTDRFINWDRSYEELLRHAIFHGEFHDDALLPTGRTLGQTLSDTNCG